MAIIAKLQFGDNGFRRYSREYLVTNFKSHVVRSHNLARPDGDPACDCLELTLIAPGREDLNLFEWYVDRSAMSGRILVELSTPANNQEVEYKEILFEDGICFALCEQYRIDEKRRRTIRLSIAVRELTVDSITL